MTIVANGGGPVRRFTPAIILLLHDMTVGISRGIIGEIGPTLSVSECVRTHSCGNANGKPEKYPSEGKQFHASLVTLASPRPAD